MTPESQNGSMLGNGSTNTFPRKRKRTTIEKLFFVVRATRVATQRFGICISAAVNQHATIDEAVCCVGSAPRLYNEDLKQLEL
jgi:hypothetical protein